VPGAELIADAAAHADRLEPTDSCKPTLPAAGTVITAYALQRPCALTIGSSAV
jgi:hypothetical protein